MTESAPLVQPVGAEPLAGLRVAVTRSVDRAGALLAALAAAGAEPVLVPLIDFEVAEQNALGAAMRRLAAGEFQWLVISSITTVRALKQWCEGAGTSLAALIPAGTSVATIGPTSVDILAAEGILADLAPTDVQSAAGLVALWPPLENDAGSGCNRVLLPSSNLAAPTLRDGLAAKGWDVEAVTAYKTVDYPACTELRLTATLESRSPERGWLSQGRPATGEILVLAREPRFQQLSPAQADGEIQAGAINAVVLASGSAARRVAATLTPLPKGCLVVAIGEPTRAESERLGMPVAATAEHPTPEGIVAALARARTNFQNHTAMESS
ncbi:uroporphyrinogen-III synthase [Arthrobacter sp. lap29]|uniref:uroporphyrinogen-III synthase n=1 Tax=Arthrobacter sp. lap29 TaxID=3056122 RepID=UPI0028F6F846|nr:uroporphyrinogen-III synthase [Arthrobacter sp. lap29]